MSLLFNNTFLLVASSIVAVIMATLMIFIRVKAAEKPTSVKRIILPPLFMSTGALMFIFPYFRVQSIEVIEAFIIGIIFSLLLIRQTKFEVKNDGIYLIPSRAFIFILFGLLILRTAVKFFIGSTISFGETSGMFFLLGFSMIMTWRAAMLYKYIQLRKNT